MFTIRRMDCGSRHDGKFSINRPNGYDCRLILFVKTEAVFTIKGADIIIQPNTFIMYDKFDAHRYRAYGSEYINDWIQADCSADQFGQICGMPIFIGDRVNIGSYMKLISDAFFRNCRSACSMLIEAMLTEVGAIIDSAVSNSSRYREMLDLRHDIYTQPNAVRSIKTIAEKMHISESYLQELYKKTFGISIGADIIYGRIDTAKMLLLDTELTAAEVGYHCGYNSSVHFSRQFSKIVGTSPAEWRKKQMKT